MKKIVPLIVILALILTGCGSLTGGNSTVSDAEMATRVAAYLATMTTPTSEIEFPATPTPQPTAILITATPLVTATPVVVVDTPTATAEGEVTETSAAATETTTTETVTSTPEVTPTATATTSSTDPAVTLGTATGSDSMDSASNWTWPTGADEYLKVVFSNGYMQMTGLTTYAGWRLPLVSQQVDSYIELTANSGSCEGKDSYGIIFRVPVFKNPDQGYLYEVTCDGYYRLWKWDGEASTDGLATALIPWSQSTLINSGANQTNRLGVMVKGSSYTLYMNGVALSTAKDSSFAAGFFGAFVRSADSSGYTVNFDAMKYWENPNE